MKRLTITFFIALLVVCLSPGLKAQVNNIRIKQEGLSKVFVNYDLVGGGTYEISLYLKPDSWSKPFLLKAVTGDVGSNVTAGKDKSITWDAVDEVQNLFTDKAQFLIKAVPIFNFLDKKLVNSNLPYGLLDIEARDCSIWINDSLAGRNSVRAKFSPGKYKIKASKDDKNYEDEIVEITLKDRETKHVELTPKLFSGRAYVKSNPSMAEIYLDNITTNKFTPYSISVPAGAHQITLKKKGYEDNAFDISMNRDIGNFLFNKELVKKKVMKGEVLKHRRRKTFWLLSSIISSGIGLYAYQESNSKYSEYLDASGTDVLTLKNQYETMDKIYPVAFGVAGFCFLEFIIQGAKQARARKQLTFYPIPVKNGGGMGLTYNF